jgi:hypothetical protein
MAFDVLNTPELMTRDQFAAMLHELREEHRALDGAISALHEQRPHDQLSILRLKRRKLLLKDKIAWCQDQLTPDIIA